MYPDISQPYTNFSKLFLLCSKKQRQTSIILFRCFENKIFPFFSLNWCCLLKAGGKGGLKFFIRKAWKRNKIVPLTRNKTISNCSVHQTFWTFYFFLGWWGHISFLPFSSTISKVQNQSHRYNHKHLQLGSDDQHLKEHHWSFLWVKKSASPKENKSYKIRRQQEEGKECLSATTCAGQQLLGVSSSPGCRCPHRRCCCSREWFICTDPVHFKQNQLNIPHPTLSLCQKTKRSGQATQFKCLSSCKLGRTLQADPVVGTPGR